MNQTPSVPIMFHFAAEDAHISMDDVAVVEKAQPDAPLFLYEADHGFNCNHRATTTSQQRCLPCPARMNFLMPISDEA